METEPNFEHFCRICTIEHEVGIMIFSDEGEKMMLRDNIVKYLHIEVASGDRLPKTICISCCTRLDSFRLFSEMAQQSQQKLSEYLHILDTRPPEKYSKNECFLKDRKINGHKYHIDEDSEMEMRLDPMMFLKCEINDGENETSQEVFNNFVSPEDEGVNYYSRGPTVDHAIIQKALNTENIDNSITIELVRKEGKKVLKLENEKSSKSLPGLKPIKLTKRQKTHEEMKPFACPLCPRGFNSNLALQSHTWLHFKNKSNLQTNANGRVICPICLKDFSTKTNLKIHMESHLPKSNFTCDICGRIFKSDVNLQRHKECHGDEIYACKDCGRVYPSNSTLKAHCVTHSDERPHNCPLCKKTFKRNQDLKFHINQHTGARPYRCPYCPKAFASSGNCFSHRKRMHPMEIERDKDKSHNTNAQ